LSLAGSSPALVLRGARQHGDVHVIDGRITALGASTALDLRRRHDAEEMVLDARDCIVTAGLVNTHHHLFQRILRGRGIGCDLLGWLRELLPVWAALDREDMAVAAKLAAAELALSGVSTTADHHFVVLGGDDSIFDCIVDAVAEVGLRLVLCRGAIDLTEQRGGFVPAQLAEDPDDVASSVERLHRHYRQDPMVDVAVAPSGLFAVSVDLLEAASEVSQRTGCRLHLHLAETSAEAGYCQRRFGRGAVELLEDLGWLERGMWLAHGVHLDAAARGKLGAASVGVAHCPASNARLGSGIAEAVALAGAGCQVGLGIDGASANDAGSMLTQVRLAWWLARARGGASACSPGDAWSWATEGGARAMGRPDLGALTVGSPADLAVWDVTDLDDFEMPEDLADLLVLGPDRPVRHLVVAGRPVVIDGVVQGLDLEALRAELAQRARALSKRLST
jgi:cytosine/adenosine deaminase-related metal-dependent hydrolase